MDIEFLLDVGKHCEDVLGNIEAELKARKVELRSHSIDRDISYEMCGSLLTREEAGVLGSIMQSGAVCG